MTVKEKKPKAPAGMLFHRRVSKVTSQVAILSSLPRDPRLVPCIFHELQKGWASPLTPGRNPRTQKPFYLFIWLVLKSHNPTF